MITHTGEINVDMNDIKTVMSNSGVAIMGAGRAEGEGRALAAVTDAMESPLLNDNDITGARYVLLNITYGKDEALMDEITEITDHIQDCAGQEAEVIWGYGADDSLENQLCVTVIATGFEVSGTEELQKTEEVEKLVLEVGDAKAIDTVLDSPTSGLGGTVFHGDSEGDESESSDLSDIHIKGTDTAERATVGMESDEVRLKFTGEDITEAGNEPETAETLHDLFATMPNDGMPNDGLRLKTLNNELQDMEPLQPLGEMETSGETLAGDFRIFDIADDVETSHFPEDVSGIKFTDEQQADELESDLQGNTTDFTPSEAIEINSESHGEPVAQADTVNLATPAVSPEDIQKLSEDRMKRIMESTSVLRTPTGLSKLENEPAYKRRNVNLSHVPHSSESTTSRLSVENDGDNGPELRSNNPFLHDNVD